MKKVAQLLVSNFKKVEQSYKKCVKQIRFMKKVEQGYKKVCETSLFNQKMEQSKKEYRLFCNIVWTGLFFCKVLAKLFEGKLISHIVSTGISVNFFFLISHKRGSVE